MRRLIRIALWALGGLGVVLVVIAASGYVASNSRLRHIYATDPESLSIQTDSANIVRGQHLAVAAAHCAGCHGANLAGQVMVDAPPFLIASSNLTSGQGGVGARYSDADWVRAIRHGVRPDGQSLLLMPAGDFAQLTDADLAAIIAYVKSVPSVDTQLPASTLRPLGRALLLAGKLDVLSAEQAAQAPPRAAPIAPGPTTAYGGYLVTIGGCRACHGGTFTGGVVPDGSNVVAPNISASGLAGWAEDDFIRTMREGKTPQGRLLSAMMPWREVGQLTDNELRAVWRYLRSAAASEASTDSSAQR